LKDLKRCANQADVGTSVRAVVAGEVTIAAGLMDRENGSCTVDDRNVLAYSGGYDEVVVGRTPDDKIWNLVPREPVSGDQKVILGIRFEQTPVGPGLVFDVGRQINDAAL
jgi:hypothetical protein